ncbi:hypothetical protein, partial [Collinsella aerofaciens]|uniref:hypothetical protein n=1 Tax=Collinsella aerofaciens TaxID=74426 RepID=UPI00359C7C46
IRQGATIVQSQEDDGAECQSWSNRAFLIPVPEKSLCIESHNYHFVNISMKLTPWRILAVKIPQGLTTNL